MVPMIIESSFFSKFPTFFPSLTICLDPGFYYCKRRKSRIISGLFQMI